MFGLWIAVVGAMLLAVNLAVSVPAQEQQVRSLAADVASTNFYAYRTAVVNYLYAHPGTSGNIADSSLTFLPGYIRDARWTNTVQGGTLFVYSTGTATIDSVNSIYQKGGKSVLIGKKAASGNLISATGIDTGIPLPAGIPVGSITIVGN
jgi:hypothetical protein